MNTDKTKVLSYTKGNWDSYQGHDGQFKDNPYILAENPQGKHHPELVIAECKYIKGETLANAQLISAAPDMYEALKALIDDAHYNSLTKTWSIGPFNEHPDGRFIMSRKALAKAEGK
jgi:hypothetical protein